MSQIWVLEYTGVPPAEVFNSTGGRSTPLVIDNTDDTAYYYKEGTGVTPLAADSWTYLYLTSDYTLLSSTPTDIPGLAFTPEASSTYIVEAQLLVSTDIVDNGPAPGVNWPSGLSSGVVRITVPESSTSEAVFNGNISADGRAIPATFPVNTILPGAVASTFSSGASPSGNFALTLSSAT